MPELTRDEELRSALSNTRVIAILGAHDDVTRAAFYVPDCLYEKGYRVLPINPTLAGQRLWNQPVRRCLADIHEPVDMVNIFRRSEDIPAHVEEILNMQPHPRLVWLQLGIRNDLAVQKLLQAGLNVVQDRCSMVDQRRLGARPPQATHPT